VIGEQGYPHRASGLVTLSSDAVGDLELLVDDRGYASISSDQYNSPKHARYLHVGHIALMFVFIQVIQPNRL